MKKVILLSLMHWIFVTNLQAQKQFAGYFYNNEYNVYLKIDLHGDGIEVPGHELFGLLPGYLGKKNNNFFWLITTKEIKSKKAATIELINYYGSEDLTASFTMKNDSTYVLKQLKGSDLKVPNKGKWQKLPTEMIFKKQ